MNTWATSLVYRNKQAVITGQNPPKPATSAHDTLPVFAILHRYRSYIPGFINKAGCNFYPKPPKTDHFCTPERVSRAAHWRITGLGCGYGSRPVWSWSGNGPKRASHSSREGAAGWRVARFLPGIWQGPLSQRTPKNPTKHNIWGCFPALERAGEELPKAAQSCPLYTHKKGLEELEHSRQLPG